MIAATRLALSLAVALLPAVTACHWGGRAEKFPPALSPVGAHVRVRVRSESADRAGELYAVDSVGVTIRAARVTRIHWPVVATMRVDGLGREYDIRSGSEPIAREQREQLAPVSRFPQGLSGELLARVLASLGQDAREEVR